MTTSLRNARRLFGALATAAGIAIASSAAADPLEITLNQPPTLGGFPGPYATVTYNRVDNDTATFTFTALGSYFLFDGSTAALNFNLGGGTLSLFSITGNSPCANPYSSGGAGVVGGR